jgi:predicted pyridoxine 5'-phosphate oxidase superfamily flavin-nucleotide-binding protein
VFDIEQGEVMIQLTQQMRDLIDPALAKGTPCLVATASKDGLPNIGYKGSVMVFDDESLAYWERTRQGTAQNVEENPNVMILFRDPATRAAWRFVGKATVHQTGALRDQVMARTVQAELDRDPDRKGFAVIVKVDKVLPITGQTPMQSRDN